MQESNFKETNVGLLNAKYFKTLIITRASIEKLYISWVGLGISLLLTLFTWNIAKYGYKVNPLKNIANNCMILNVIFMATSLIMVRVSKLRNFLYKHQAFAAIWLFLFSILFTFELVSMSYFLTQGNSANEIWYESERSIMVLLLFIISYLGSLIYNYHWLRKQLKKGFSEERRKANYLAKVKFFESKSLWLIYGCTMIGSLVTGNFIKITGVILGIFFGAVFSRLTIEYGYAAYLLNTDKSYWVDYEEEPKQTIKEMLVRRLKKPSTYVIFGIILLLVLLEINSRCALPRVVNMIFSYMILFLLLGLGLVFVRWLARKFNNRR